MRRLDTLQGRRCKSRRSLNLRRRINEPSHVLVCKQSLNKHASYIGPINMWFDSRQVLICVDSNRAMHKSTNEWVFNERSLAFYRLNRWWSNLQAVEQLDPSIHLDGSYSRVITSWASGTRTLRFQQFQFEFVMAGLRLVSCLPTFLLIVAPLLVGHSFSGELIQLFTDCLCCTTYISWLKIETPINVWCWIRESPAPLLPPTKNSVFQLRFLHY